MVERLADKVALVTGAARGQGRAESVLLAEHGAQIIGIDVCAPLPDIRYEPATPADLEETGRLVRKTGRTFLGAQIDVRDLPRLESLVADAVADLGRLDIVVANAGISTWGRLWELTAEQWQTMIDINLTGVWNTLRSTVPTMIELGNGGSIILTSSVGGLKALPGQAHYIAAKHGVVGLARVAAVELGPFNIRVNSIHPWGVDTPMGSAEALGELLTENPTYAVSYSGAPLAEPRVATAVDIANTVLFLASDDSRCITGAQLPVDMGATKV